MTFNDDSSSGSKTASQVTSLYNDTSHHHCQYRAAGFFARGSQFHKANQDHFGGACPTSVLKRMSDRRLHQLVRTTSPPLTPELVSRMRLVDPMEAPAIEDDEEHVFTTVRWDPALLQSTENTAASCHCPCPFYMLEHHWTRLNIAKWSTSLARQRPSDLLADLLLAVHQWHSKHPSDRPESLRVKHRVYAGGRSRSEIVALPRISLDHLFPTTFGRPSDRPDEVVWTVCIDAQPVETSATTMYKTWDRSFYDRARALAGITSYQQPKEVLLYNHRQEIMDASICTPYFFRDERWVTPSADCGGQQGTTRRWALEKGLCVEGEVRNDDLRVGEVIWLSNAVRGYFRARYVSRDDTVNAKPPS